VTVGQEVYELLWCQYGVRMVSEWC
jgi:hypothetical protein